MAVRVSGCLSHNSPCFCIPPPLKRETWWYGTGGFHVLSVFEREGVVAFSLDPSFMATACSCVTHSLMFSPLPWRNARISGVLGGVQCVLVAESLPLPVCWLCDSPPKIYFADLSTFWLADTSCVRAALPFFEQLDKGMAWAVASVSSIVDGKTRNGAAMTLRKEDSMLFRSQVFHGPFF